MKHVSKYLPFVYFDHDQNISLGLFNFDNYKFIRTCVNPKSVNMGDLLPENVHLCRSSDPIKGQKCKFYTKYVVAFRFEGQNGRIQINEFAHMERRDMMHGHDNI